ncbi:MAG TPA: MBL fold metallo-hydrolase [Chloroflexota bacterium]|nr:MBL fold metallo-hydrolase [Chloroflexota bacterium]
MNGLREIAADVFQLEMPLPYPRLPTVNIYLVRDGGELGLVDTGMNVPGAFDQLTSYLDHLGHTFAQVRQIVITHHHPDHIGLCAPVRDASGGNVVLHRLDAALLHTRYREVDDSLRDVVAFLALHGAPEGESGALSEASLGMRQYVSLCQPDMEVQGGETVHVGSHALELVWTPGHTAGHVVVYEPERKLLFSGDHLLLKISPNVGKHPQSSPDPLHEFERSLRAVAPFDVAQTLPAHGDCFGQPAQRVTELLEHHRARRQRCADAIGSGALTGWDVSRIVFARVQTPHEQRMALFETLAHLEAMRVEGTLAQTVDAGRAYWRVKVPAPVAA